MISHIEVRSEQDADLLPFVHEKQIETIRCPPGLTDGVPAIKNKLTDLMKPLLQRLNDWQLLYCNNPNNINSLLLNEALE